MDRGIEITLLSFDRVLGRCGYGRYYKQDTDRAPTDGESADYVMWSPVKYSSRHGTVER